MNRPLEEHVTFIRHFGHSYTSMVIFQDNEEGLVSFWKKGVCQPGEYTVAIWKLKRK